MSNTTDLKNDNIKTANSIVNIGIGHNKKLSDKEKKKIYNKNYNEKKRMEKLKK